MKVSDLKHGDVLLYQKSKRASLVSSLIRLIIGSKIVHVGIVQELNGELYVLEQTAKRLCTHLAFYIPDSEEIISCARPTFVVPPIDLTLIEKGSYGYLSICDCLLNHGIAKIYSKRVFKPLLVRLTKTPKLMCSSLVARALKLEEKFDWSLYPSVVEPDDFINRPNFEQLGIVIFTE